MNPRLPIILLAAACLSFSARKAMGAEKSEAGITLRLIACQVSEELPKVYLETEGSKTDVFELPSSTLSAPMTVSARKVDLRSPDNDAALCSITLPDQGRSFAILLAPGDAAGYTPHVIRLDDGSFKAGDFFFVNTTAKTVALKLGSTGVVVEAGSAVKSRPTEPVHQYYNIGMSTRSESGDRVFASTRWPLEQNNRSFIMFLTGPNERISYRAVDE